MNSSDGAYTTAASESTHTYKRLPTLDLPPAATAALASSVPPAASPVTLETNLQITQDVDDDGIDRPAPVPMPVNTNAHDTAAVDRIRLAECIGMVLAIIAALIGIAFFITLFVVDNDTLHSEYDDMFTPRSVLQYKWWGYTTLALTSIAVMLTMVMTGMGNDSPLKRRGWLPFTCAIYVVLLASGNILGAVETTARRSDETAFAAKFNMFYCSARTVRVCLDDDREPLLMLTRGTNATAVLPSENAAEVASSVWSRCQELLMWGISSTGTRVRTRDGKKKLKKGVLAIDTKPLYKFLDDYDSSAAIDTWCGSANRRSTPMSNAEQRTLPSPHASHPRVFARYKDEWSKRMLFANLMLGAALGCLVVMFAVYKVVK